MTYEAYIVVVEQCDTAPEEWSLELKSLFAERKGDWHQAHDLCQQEGTANGDRIHAYLHRKEGDEGNASYWYHRSGEAMPICSLDEEWSELVRRFL